VASDPGSLDQPIDRAGRLRPKLGGESPPATTGDRYLVQISAALDQERC